MAVAEILKLNHEFRCGAYSYHASLLQGDRVYGFVQQRGVFNIPHYLDLRDWELTREEWYRQWKFDDKVRYGVGGSPGMAHIAAKYTKRGMEEAKARKQGKVSVLIEGKSREELLTWTPSHYQSWLLPFLDALPVDKIKQELKAKNIPEPLGFGNLVRAHSGGYKGLDETFEQWVLRGKVKG